MLGGTFAAGTYTFRLNEAGNPDSGSLSLEISVVPLPAGFPLLLGALGALVLVRRRYLT